MPGVGGARVTSPAITRTAPATSGGREPELGGADVLVNNAGVMLLGSFGSDQRDDYRQRAGDPHRAGGRRDQLPTHITHAETKKGVGLVYDKAEVTADDVAEVIAFAVARPRRLAIHEILLRTAGQEL